MLFLRVPQPCAWYWESAFSPSDAYFARKILLTALKAATILTIRSISFENFPSISCRTGERTSQKYEIRSNEYISPGVTCQPFNLKRL